MTVPEHERDFDEAGEWVLVPREPTEAMVRKMADAWTSHDDRWNAKATYRAMLAARPTPPESEQGGSSISPFIPPDTNGEYYDPDIDPPEEDSGSSISSEVAELVRALERILAINGAPVGAGDGDTYFVDVGEGQRMRAIARDALSPFRGKPG